MHYVEVKMIYFSDNLAELPNQIWYQCVEFRNQFKSTTVNEVGNHNTSNIR